jgi:hypothetical protein
VTVLVYAFVSVRFLSGCIVTLLSDHGDIVSIFSANTWTLAKKMATNEISIGQCERFYPNKLVHIEWVDSPYKNEGVKSAMVRYEKKHEIPFNGAIERSQIGAELPRFG